MCFLFQSFENSVLYLCSVDLLIASASHYLESRGVFHSLDASDPVGSKLVLVEKGVLVLGGSSFWGLVIAPLKVIETILLLWVLGEEVRKRVIIRVQNWLVLEGRLISRRNLKIKVLRGTLVIERMSQVLRRCLALRFLTLLMSIMIACIFIWLIWARFCGSLSHKLLLKLLNLLFQFFFVYFFLHLLPHFLILLKP